MGSDEVSKKMTYAKLYKPFDWVVATGIHYDDIDSIVLKRRQAFEKVYDGQVMVFLAMLASVFVICCMMLYIFEKQLNSMINRFVAKIKINEAELRCEKEKLSEAYRELEDVAFVDYLTGLFNRRAMCDIIKKNLERCRLDGANFCLILADIDKFKSINDIHGHDAGDIVLKSVAAL
jgi:predicted signal transduction protein with EAL and GGDEF domain